MVSSSLLSLRDDMKIRKTAFSFKGRQKILGAEDIGCARQSQRAGQPAGGMPILITDRNVTSDGRLFRRIGAGSISCRTGCQLALIIRSTHEPNAQKRSRQSPPSDAAAGQGRSPFSFRLVLGRPRRELCALLG